jgi:hypothetical protein
MIMQVRLRGEVFLRASLVRDAAGEQALVFSIGHETGDHTVRVPDTTAHALLTMLQLAGRGS